MAVKYRNSLKEVKKHPGFQRFSRSRRAGAEIAGSGGLDTRKDLNSQNVHQNRI